MASSKYGRSESSEQPLAVADKWDKNQLRIPRYAFEKESKLTVSFFIHIPTALIILEFKTNVRFDQFKLGYAKPIISD